eukprot:gene21257-23330_t
MVEMYHAGTPSDVKSHISHQMTLAETHLRVLCCTIAFGMGVNVKQAHHCIHFGVPMSPENYLQESGRIGRDGEQSYSLILFNGLLSGRASTTMKDYIYSQSCKRVQLMKHFPSLICSTGVSITGRHCCDNCANSCDCSSFNNWSLIISCDENRAQKVRKVSLAEKEKIKEMLESYSASLNSRDRPRMVSVPNIFLEFGHFHIDQVSKLCHKILKKSDLYDCVEIWHTVHANNILVVLHEVFEDIEEDISDLDLVKLSEDDENAVCPEWQCIRDDTAGEFRRS